MGDRSLGLKYIWAMCYEYVTHFKWGEFQNRVILNTI